MAKFVMPVLPSIETLAALAREGEDGRFWYRSGRAEIARAAEILAVSAGRLADLLSVFSPRVQVRRSIQMTVWYLEHGTTVGVMKGVRAALAHYEATGEIRGPKTGPFALALRGDDTAIVLDVWMARAFGIKHSRITGKRIGEACKCAIREVAARLGWTPAEVQAAIWTATVRAHGKTPAPMGIAEVIGK